MVIVRGKESIEKRNEEARKIKFSHVFPLSSSFLRCFFKCSMHFSPLFSFVTCLMHSFCLSLFVSKYNVFVLGVIKLFCLFFLSLLLFYYYPYKYEMIF